ncbi:MAG: hypothetical protein KAV18_01130 [Candidatus Omnitrophica bacterium]|nr:hypothetical protein [Candidatus Omnitrophota bacterium]
MSYGREINPIIAEPKMYIDMLKEKDENVGKQLLRDKNFSALVPYYVTKARQKD